jgi:rhodanese-related sulfurtransferase
MRKNLFLTLIVLGLVVLAAALTFSLLNQPHTRLGSASADVAVLARSIARNEDHVSAGQLADWVIEDRKDFVLIDLRPAERFAAQHIQTARNTPLTALLSKEGLVRLPRDQMIVLYGDDSAQAAQVSVLLRLAGYQAYFLDDGLAGWTRQVLQPAITAAGDAESRKREAVARHFGGQGLAAASAESQAAPAAPTETRPPGAPSSNGAVATQPPVASVPAYTPPLSPVTPASEAPAQQEGKLIVDQGC